MADIQSNIKVNIDTNGALASLKVLQGQISAFHQEMGRSGALATSEMSRLQNNFMNAVNRSGQFDARMKTIKTTTESFTEALEKNKLSMGQYFKYAGAATKDFGKLFKGEFDTIEKVARERVKDLQTQYVKMGRDANGAMKAIAVRPLMLDMNDLGTKTQIAAQKQQLLNQLLKQGSTNMLNWGKNTQWAGRQLMVGFTVPLTMLGQIASKTFMDMETQVLKFQRVYGDFSTTTQQTKEMTAEVTSLAKAFTKYGVAVSDTMGMAADAAAMGKQGKDLLAQVDSASRLSVLGGIDQKQALETTISLTNAFGISADDLRNKINFLNVVENQTVTSIDDLTTAIPKAAPVIKQLGGNVEDLAFFLTAMKEGGINASEGANALKSGIASIINPTKKASDMLSGFGINIKGIVTANKGNVRGMVMGVAEALNKLDPLNRAKAIEQLFGKFQFARISTLFKNITDVNSQASQVAKLAAQGPEASAILAQRELKKIEDSPMFKFKKALEDLKVQLIPLGEQFLKAVTPIAQFFNDLLKNFNSLGSGTKDTIGLITGLVAGIGPLALMVIGLIANGIANMIKLFAGVKSFFNNLGKGTQDLGSQTAYMTQEQIDAQAVAASLNQTHSKLTQTFTSEAGAIAKLRAEMERAVAIQNQFNWSGTAVKTGVKPGKKMATGGVVQGPGGPKDDAVPTNLSNGEVVLSVDTVKKNPGIIGALLQGKKVNIPGFADSGIAGGGPVDFAHVTERSTIGLQDLAKLLSQAPGKVSQAVLANIQELAATFGNSVKAHMYSGLGFTQSKKLNVGMRDGGAVPASDFLKDFNQQGTKKWEQTLANAGLKLQDVQAELEQYDRALAAGVQAMLDQNKNATITSEEFAQLEKQVRESIPATSRLRTGLDTAATALHEVRINVNDKDVRAAGLEPYEVPSGTGNGKMSTKKRFRMASGREARTGGNRIIRKTALGGLGFESTLDAPIVVGQQDTTIPKAEGKSTAKKKGDAFDAGLIEQGQIQSPSKVTKEIGANYGKGFIIGAEQALQSPVASPASIQHAKDQLRSILKPYTDPQGIINTEKLNSAYQVQVRVLTDNEKAIRQGIQLMRVARLPQDTFWKAMDKTGQVAAAAGTAIKTGVLNTLESLKLGVIDLGNKVKNAANQVKEGANKFGNNIKTRWNDQYDVDPETGEKKLAKEGWKTQMKNNFKGAGGVMAVGALAGAATMLPGKAGEVAGQVAGPITAAAGAFMMLPGPIGAVLAGLTLLVSVVDMVNKANEQLRQDAAKLGTAMSATAEKTNKFGEATGTVSASEIANKRQETMMANMTSGQLGEGEKLLQSDAGQQMLTDVNTMKNSGLDSKQISAALSQQIGQAVAQGVMSFDQANSLAASIGNKLNDMSISTQIEGSLTGLFGPDGTDLTKDPLKVMMNLQQQGAQAGVANFNDQVKTTTGGRGGSYTYIADMKQALAGAGATSASYGNIQNNIDASNAAYDKKIAAETDLVKQQQLISQKEEAASALATDPKSGYAAVIKEMQSQASILGKHGKNYEADVFKPMVQQSAAYTTAKANGDTTTTDRIDDVINQVGNITGKDINFRRSLEGQFNQLGDQNVQHLINLGKNSSTFEQNYMGVANTLGTSKANEVAQTLAGTGMSDKQQAKEYGKITSQSMGTDGKIDKTQLDAYLQGLREINNLANTVGGAKIDVTTPKGQQTLDEYKKTLTDMENGIKKNGGKFKFSMLADAKITGKDADKVWSQIKKLKPGQQAAYVAQYKAIMKFKGDPQGPLAKAYEKWRGNTNKTFDDYARYLAGQSATSTSVAGGDTGTTTPKDTTSTGGTAPTKTDKANAALSILGRKEEKINKAYDERVKALDEIQKANDRINQQQKDQLDLADALSKGDIGAAARAQQQARQNAQTTALQQQQEGMAAARDAQIASLRVNGMSRAGLEAFLAKESDKSDKKTLGGWHMSIGGVVPKTQYFALGGKPRGTDTIAAMLTPGEFVMKKSAVDSIGTANMHKINNGKLPGGGSSMYNYSVMINVKSDADADQIAKTVISQIKKIDNQAMKGNNA